MKLLLAEFACQILSEELDEDISIAGLLARRGDQTVRHPKVA